MSTHIRRFIFVFFVLTYPLSVSIGHLQSDRTDQKVILGHWYVTGWDRYDMVSFLDSEVWVYDDFDGFNIYQYACTNGILRLTEKGGYVREARIVILNPDTLVLTDFLNSKGNLRYSRRPWSEESSLPVVRSRPDFLTFLPDNMRLVTLCREAHRRSSGDRDSISYSVEIISTFNGELLNAFSLPKRGGFVCAFTISHDGLKCAALSSPEYPDTTTTIQEYSLSSGELLWEQPWHGDYRCSHLAYNKSNTKIIGASALCTTEVSADSGVLIRRSDAISQVDKVSSRWLVQDLSSNGKFFAMWWCGILTFSRLSEGDPPRLLDIVWYGIKWLYHFGSIPNYVSVWDIDRDTLACRFPVEYSADDGVPTFTDDEKQLMIGPVDGTLRAYDLKQNALVREYPLDPVSFEANRWVQKSSYTTISPDLNCFAMLSGSRPLIILASLPDGIQIEQFRQDLFGRGGRYAMAFSSNGKYFAVVTKRNKLVLYDLDARKIVWAARLSD